LGLASFNDMIHFNEYVVMFQVDAQTPARFDYRSDSTVIYI
jgi:hypothetical protein